MFHDAFAYSEADSASRIALVWVKTLKEFKDLLLVFRRYTNAVIFYRKYGFGTGPPAIDYNLRRGAAAVLHGIAQKILKDLFQVHLVHVHRKEIPRGDGSPALVGSHLQVRKRVLECNVRINGVRHYVRLNLAGLYIRKQVLNERVHSSCAFDAVLKVFLAVDPYGIFEVPGKHLTINADHAQRFFEIMRSGIGKLLEIGVGAP